MIGLFTRWKLPSRGHCSFVTMLYRTIFLLCMITRTMCVDRASSPRIVIVGAGSSGIAAASRLLQNGVDDLLILEAENRIGGRVHTTKFDDYVVDMGAQWIHGERGNVAYELAAPLNITEHSEPYRITPYTASGEKIEPTIANNFTDLFTRFVEETPEQNCTGSLAECFDDRLKQYLTEVLRLNETLTDQLLWQFDQIQTSYEAADSSSDVSMRGYQSYINPDGDHSINWKTRGYSTILDILMKKFPNPEQELPVLNKTILGAEVSKIDYSNENGVVKVTTLDGKEYTADHVIVTVSLGVLKEQHETLFHPSLPESKTRNIKGLGFGNACKIYLAFNDTWFNDEALQNGGYSLLFSEDERKKLQSDPKTMWIPHALGFFFVEHKPRLLLLWVSGKGGRLMDDLTDEEVFDQTVQLLYNALSKDYNVSRPIAMIRSKWHQNKHFRGTWSYVSMETTRTNSSAMGLSEPIVKMGKPVILFAGEATNSNYYSTVHGAIGAGWREADRLINLYRKNINTTRENS